MSCADVSPSRALACLMFGAALLVSAVASPARADTPAATAPEYTGEAGFLSGIRAMTGIHLPPGTQVLGLEYVAGDAGGLRVKVRFNPDQLRAFAEHHYRGGGLFSEDQRRLLSPDRQWWDPHAQAQVDVYTFPHHEPGTMEVVMVPADPDSYVPGVLPTIVVYIEWTPP